MSGRHRDHHTCIAEWHHTDAVHDGDALDGPSLPDRLPNPAHLSERHLGIRFVLQANHPPAVVVVARGADERDGRPGARMRNRCSDPRRVNRPGNDFVHWFRH